MINLTKNALGMIEVKGLLGSIVAADIALKTANVHLVNNDTIRGGLTSIELFGDVGAIKESVRVAKESIMETGCYISSNVIANLDPQVEKMILESIEKKEKKVSDESNHQETASKQSDSIDVDKEKVINEFLKENNRQDLTAIEDLKVTELRSLAYALEIDLLTKKEIKFANKETLIDTLLKEGVGEFVR